MSETASKTIRRKRKSRVSVGDHLALGELWSRGFAAQLVGAREHRLLVQAGDGQVETIRVTTAHGTPWYLRRSTFVRSRTDQVTIYVLLGLDRGTQSVRFFVARKSDLAAIVLDSPTKPEFVSVDARSLKKYENNWDALKVASNQREKRS